MRHHHHHHHHHNMEQLHHPKQLHYPSGYPMPRSPPLFICSSPGPDPYRSHDNVYEELEHSTSPPPGGAGDSDSEPDRVVNGLGGVAIHSDDDFAEDELSLPGESSVVHQRTFHKSTPDGGTGSATAATTTVATIYQDVGQGGDLERNRTERNSLLSCSGSSSGNDQGVNNRNSSSSADGASSSSSGNNNTAASSKVSHNPGGGLFRSRKQASSSTLGSGRGKRHGGGVPADPPCELGMTPMAYDERAMMTLPPSYAGNHPAHLNSINNNSSSFVNNSNSLNNNIRSNYYSTIDDREEGEVERRNRINAQLSAANLGGGAVSTIFRGGRPPFSNNHHSHHQQQHQPSSRSRTNPRSLDRRRYLQNNNTTTVATTPNGNSPLTVAQDPSQYIYHEPVFHEGLIYDGCLSYSDRSSGGSTGPPYPYVLPAPFTTFRNGSGPNSGGTPNQHHHQVIYSRDSSFGSDSGYSQHTQASNRSGNWNRNRLPLLQRPPVCEPQAADS